MMKFTANYCYSNPNFVITNLPDQQKVTPYTNIIRITQNLITRGAPTIASQFLRDQLGLDRNYLHHLEHVKFLSTEDLDWSKQIKGDKRKNHYPAEKFYNDFGKILNSVGFIRNLTRAEVAISEIVPEVSDTFAKQQVDFYIPLLKTVIEVDGGSDKDETGHFSSNQILLDNRRDTALNKAGIHVIRISSKEIMDRNYSDFLSKFRDIYLKHRTDVTEYEKYLNLDKKKYDAQITLTAVARVQVFILELLDRGVLSLDDDQWSINLLDDNARYYFELGMSDLELWLRNIAALFNKQIRLPKIGIMVNKYAKLTPAYQKTINIKFDLFKRWDDSVEEARVYHIKTDFDDHANYNLIKVNEPVVYQLDPDVHRSHLEFLTNNLFGHSSFNEGQLDIIINCLNGHDTIGLLPTGGGKSLTYQLSVMLQPAISFVVVPIKSLMLDQIRNLERKHFITTCSYINSDLGAEEANQRLDQFSKGKYMFLIISPERFQAKKFREQLANINLTKAISIAVIDEVHCLSEWGHEFRTSYLVLSRTIRTYAPSARFLALTATASSKVLLDIRNELEIENHNVITISRFTRNELNFNVAPITPKERDDALMSNLVHFKSRSTKRAALVFTSNVNGNSGCYELHHKINKATGFKTGFFSGSQPTDWGKETTQKFTDYKDFIQQKYMLDEIDVMVATKAFGMGIDKPNIGQTIHYGIPSSLESFYQEAGRAGRDKHKSDCLILYNPDDLDAVTKGTLFGIHTDIDTINKNKSKLKGDLNTLFYFLSENLMDIETEVDEIYNYYFSIRTTEDLNLTLSFGSDGERVKAKKEKYIYRLALIGIVEDWTVDWKMGQMEVQFTDWNEDHIVEQLLKYIKKYEYTFTLTPGDRHAEQYNDYIQYFNDLDIPFLKRALYVLLRWYNDNVVYSKKQSILLMKQFADEFTDSDSFQQNIETYFKRNDDVYLLESIIGNPLNLRSWYQLFVIQEEGKPDTPRNISTFKRLRITVSRFLESYKNDIALNLISGFIHLVIDDFDATDGKERMVAAIREINHLDTEERDEILLSLLEMSDQHLDFDQKEQLSELLIMNGFDKTSDLKNIYQSHGSNTIYAHIIKSLYKEFKKHTEGGYPWEV